MIRLSTANPIRFDRARRRLTSHSTLLLLALLTLTGCWQDGPVPQQEEAEILFGSTVSGSGSLLTKYDFGVPIEVEFNTELGDFTIYSGTDPGLVSLGRDNGSGVAPLPKGVTVSIEIIAIDPEVQVSVGDTVLAAAGDRAEIGTTPIHVHPQWQLVLPSDAEPEPHFVTFAFSAPGYASSEGYTATLMVVEPAAADELTD